MSQRKSLPEYALSYTALVDWLIEHNNEQSREFMSPDARFARQQYRAQHPTEVAVLKCMDGRIHLPVQTQTPLGILQPWRNLGGKFDLGWPYFGSKLRDWVNYSIGRGRDCIVLITYHWSAGDKHRGCRGFGYDLDSSQQFTKTLKQQIERVFGSEHQTVYPIQCGLETDFDALVLHGENGEILDLNTIPDVIADDVLLATLRRMYPDMKYRMILDLLPIVRGNIAHARSVRAINRPIIDAEHCERVLALGRGFDWLHKPNFALIVGPYSPDLGEPIATAAGLLLANMEEGRVSDDGIVLLVSTPYREPAGHEPLLATEKTKFLSQFALQVITDRVPKLAGRVALLPTVIDLNTRQMTKVKMDLPK